MTIGDRIRTRRLELGLTLEDVSKVVGITRQTVQKYESGVVSNIPSDKIELLANALETTPAYLMGWWEPYATLAERLKILRFSNHITYEILSMAVGVSAQFLSEIERGRKTPSVEITKKLADYFKVSVDYLIGATDEKEMPTPVSESGPISPERQALLDAVKDMDDDTARAVLEVVRSVKKLRGE